MKLTRLRSPNCDQKTITVEYLVLHYTAADLNDTLSIFTGSGGVSAHLVIDVDGSVVELVDCLSEIAHRAWHAGVSHWQGLEAFNDFALGIELVNYNGNLFPYSEAQYVSLIRVVKQLQQHYPALRNAERILGHEHIAGFRGKADPGICFDWTRLFNGLFPEAAHPERPSVCTPEQQQTLMAWAEAAPKEDSLRSAFWQKLSERTENMVKQQF